ncbi:MAG: MerR family transcriptional regulator [Lachnospiraceae bacterium]|nr:MerR family transcriptional regulator [Lachnospiraceae bacterium]
MLINEVCKKCSLTKKAVEYYIEQGLVTPTMQENRYRSFTEEDVERLKKISILRNLGLSIADIRIVLSDRNTVALKEIAGAKKLEISALEEKQKLLQELAEGQNWKKTYGKLQQLEKKQSILERLQNVFPDYYGRYVCTHFAPYLNEPIVTDEQQEAFNTIIEFLDNTDFDVPDDLRQYLDEVLSEAATRCENGIDGFAEKMSASMREAVQDPEKFLEENREIIEIYQAYKKSDEYKASPTYRLEESLRQFGKLSGYNDIFIPAMCKLSQSYREYQEKSRKADEKLMREYPQYI